MMYHLEFDPKAYEELERSFLWYLARSIPAADGFRAELDELTELICRDPHVWPSYESGIREVLMERYPFTIVYTIIEETYSVIIVSVFHQSRHPKGK